MKNNREFKSLNIAVLSISDSRTIETDSSGDMLEKQLTESGYALAERTMVADA